jgi:hypothetical protein
MNDKPKTNVLSEFRADPAEHGKDAGSAPAMLRLKLLKPGGKPKPRVRWAFPYPYLKRVELESPSELLLFFSEATVTVKGPKMDELFEQVTEVFGIEGNAPLVCAQEPVLLLIKARSVTALAVAKSRVQLFLCVQEVDELLCMLFRNGSHLIGGRANWAVLVFPEVPASNGGRKGARDGQTRRPAPRAPQRRRRSSRSRGIKRGHFRKCRL